MEIDGVRIRISRPASPVLGEQGYSKCLISGVNVDL